MRIQDLFSGHADAYGRYDIPAGAAKTEKGKLKGTAFTERSGYSEDLWTKHLAGEAGLGIIPIRDDSHCFWGCIDIDDYAMDVPAMVKLIKEIGLPLRVFRTKSGGCHVVAFFKTPVPAQDLRDCLVEIATALGYAGSEVFPKQTVSSEDTMGNWLNMPYFGGGDDQPTMRFAYDPNTIEDLTLSEFEASCVQIEADTLFKFSLKEWLKKQSKTNEFAEAPPCLEALCAVGKFPEGTRNIGLFNMAVLRKKMADDQSVWEEQVRADNQKYMGPGSPSEVGGIIRSIRRKDYQYQCNEEPLTSRCNKNVCQLRKYGIVNRQATITGLQKLDTEPPTWIVQVDDQTLRISSSEKLKNQHLFSLAVMDQLDRAPLAYASKAWNAVIHRLFENVQTVSMPKEASRSGHLYNLIVDFVNAYPNATDLSQIHQGIPIQGRGRTFFRSQDLTSFLRDRGETDLQRRRNEFFALLRDMDGIDTEPLKLIAGVPVSLYSIETPVRAEIKSPVADDIPF